MRVDANIVQSIWELEGWKKGNKIMNNMHAANAKLPIIRLIFYLITIIFPWLDKL